MAHAVCDCQVSSLDAAKNACQPGVNAANASGLFIVTHKTHLIRSLRARDDTGRVHRQRVSCFTSLQRRDGKSINLKWNGIKMKVERDVKEKVIRFAIILWRAASRYAQCQWISLIQQFLWLQMTRVTCFSSLFDVCCFVSITWNPRNRMISLSICESNRFELPRIAFHFNPSKWTSSQYILWSQWTLVHKLVGNGGHAYEFHEMTHATGALNAKKSSDQHSDLFRVARSEESCGKFRADIKRILGHVFVCSNEWRGSLHFHNWHKSHTNALSRFGELYANWMTTHTHTRKTTITVKNRLEIYSWVTIIIIVARTRSKIEREKNYGISRETDQQYDSAK